MAKVRDKYGIFHGCLRGDVQGAIASAQARAQELSTRDERDLARLESRFAARYDVVPIRTKDDIARQFIEAYRAYYLNVLMKRSHAKDAEATLRDRIAEILTRCGVKVELNVPIDALEQPIKKTLRERGFYSLAGRIQPYCSLSVWTKQTTREHLILLPETTAKIRVNYVDDLIEHGWMAYATLGRFYSGGWVPDDTPDEIFCVTKAYKRRPEALRVNLLAHEAQHVVDLAAFPELDATDLEYRAKLTELALARRPGILLRKFLNQAIDNRQNPHGFAAYQIGQRINAKDPKGISTHALSLLAEHSTRMRHAGNGMAVRTVLP